MKTPTSARLSTCVVRAVSDRGASLAGRNRGLKVRHAYPVDLVEPVHVQLPHEARELIRHGQRAGNACVVESARTLLCLKCPPRMLRLNSPTLDTTKDVPSSVHAMNCVDLGSLIILQRGRGKQGRTHERREKKTARQMRRDRRQACPLERRHGAHGGQRDIGGSCLPADITSRGRPQKPAPSILRVHVPTPSSIPHIHRTYVTPRRLACRWTTRRVPHVHG